MISFGPIPSRRLGKSLGINNIPSKKKCSYSCIYCQVGITKECTITRETFYEPGVIYAEVKKHLTKLNDTDRPDYLTFVSNGEPTLDINLGESIIKLKAFNIPVAVITNSSLLSNRNVRDGLKHADWVSIKVDTSCENTWKKINSPLIGLYFKKHVDGLLQFSSEYQGKLVTETMLVEGINDTSEELQRTSGLIAQIKPSLAFISIPTRPPAISSVRAPFETAINEAFQIFSNTGLKTELLVGFEGTNIGYTGNVVDDIINISSVHPIREDTMMELLLKDKADDSILISLIQNKIIKQVQYNSEKFYIRHFNI